MDFSFLDDFQIQERWPVSDEREDGFHFLVKQLTEYGNCTGEFPVVTRTFHHDQAAVAVAFVEHASHFAVFPEFQRGNAFRVLQLFLILLDEQSNGLHVFIGQLTEYDDRIRKFPLVAFVFHYHQ